MTTATARLSGCSRCGGLWVGAGPTPGNLEVVAATLESFAQARPSGVPAVLCPECRANAVRASFEGVDLDVCTRHGVWFDRDEVAKVVAQGSGLSTAAMLATVRDAQRRAVVPSPPPPVRQADAAQDSADEEHSPWVTVGFLALFLGGPPLATHGHRVPELAKVVLAFVERLMAH